MNPMRPLLPWAAIAALLLFGASVWGFGAALPGYSQTLHPVSLLGATGVRHALAFNLLAYVLPGLVAALVAIDLRARLPAGAGWWSRLGTQLLLLSALGMIAMGLLPLDPQDLESASSRLHGTAWMGWLIAFAGGSAALAIGLLSTRIAVRLAWVSGVAALALLVAAFVFPAWVGTGIAQRLALAVWFGWFACAARRTSLAARA